ncbi:MAG TPA: pirin family protein [Armatimonadota bacterium]|jgi:hypothetical protein
MVTKRASEDRGQTLKFWLDSRHSFSFGGYADPEQMGFRSLRVINEDWIRPDAGFGMHPHRDMEILTVVLEGTLEHKDSLGSTGLIRAGEVQRMTAGTGIVHSESNPSSSDAVHMLQIWLFPDRGGLDPSYEQRGFGADAPGLQLLASRDGREGSLSLNQDADLYRGTWESGEGTEFVLAPGRAAWVQVLSGVVVVNGTRLEQGDGAAVEGEDVSLRAEDATQVLLFDLGPFRPEAD